MKKIFYRSLALRLDGGAPITLNTETRSIEAVAATEQPVQVFDYERWETIWEVLLMSGCELPDTRQIPLLDTHQRYTTSSVLGSARELRIEADQLVCRSYFAEVPEAEGPYEKVRTGHLTDFSIGYRILESIWVPKDETAVVEGRVFNGPIKIGKRWKPKELSICPIGADELAKARAENPNPPAPLNKENTMDKKLRAFLERRGLSTDATEVEAWTFLETLDIQREMASETDPLDIEALKSSIENSAVEKARAAFDEKLKIEGERVQEITAMGEKYKMQNLALEHVGKRTPLEDFRQIVIDKFAATPPLDLPRVQVGDDNEGAMPWGTFGEQLRAVVQAGTPGGTVDKRLSTRAVSGMSEGVPSDGGFLVQTDFSSVLLKRSYETSILASACRRVPISANANGLKINAVAETSRVDGSRWGGVQAYWEGEADSATAKKPKFRQMDLKLNKLIGLCYATDELLEDTAALESVVGQAFEEEFGFKLDDAIINGSGAGQPAGFLASAATVSVAKLTGQKAATVLAENVIGMWARCWARSRQNANWYINQDIEPQLYTMYLAVGTGGVPVYMPAGGLSGSPYGTLMGRPVVPIEQCQTLGTAGDIVLADMSQYLLIDKGTMKSDVSIHVRFIYDEQCFRFVLRVDGQPIWNSPLTPFKGSNTLSPFIKLATRS